MTNTPNQYRRSSKNRPSRVDLIDNLQIEKQYINKRYSLANPISKKSLNNVNNYDDEFQRQFIDKLALQLKSKKRQKKQETNEIHKQKIILQSEKQFRRTFSQFKNRQKHQKHQKRQKIPKNRQQFLKLKLLSIKKIYNSEKVCSNQNNQRYEDNNLRTISKLETITQENQQKQDKKCNHTVYANFHKHSRINTKNQKKSIIKANNCIRSETPQNTKLQQRYQQNIDKLMNQNQQHGQLKIDRSHFNKIKKNLNNSSQKNNINQRYEDASNNKEQLINKYPKSVKKQRFSSYSHSNRILIGHLYSRHKRQRSSINKSSQKKNRQFLTLQVKNEKQLPSVHHEMRQSMIGKKFNYMKQTKNSKEEQRYLKMMDKAISFKKNLININDKIKEQNYKQVQTLNEMSFKIYNSASRQLLRSKQSLQKTNKIQQFNSLHSKRILVFNSQDKYIKRWLINNDWIVIPDIRSQIYHLKWIYKPNSYDYNNLKKGQYINHIKNSYQLTSKDRLNVNLKNYKQQWPNLYQYYPKSYDLSNVWQKQQFKQQYSKIKMMILLQKLYKAALKYNKNLVQQLTKQSQDNYNSFKKVSQMKKTPSLLKSRMFTKKDMETYLNYNQKFLVHINLVIISLKYWRMVRKGENEDQQKEYHFLNFNKEQFQNNYNQIMKYSQSDVLYNPLATQEYFKMYYFSTPSTICLENIIKEYVYFKNEYNWFKNEKQIKNIWIVKPSSASKANGIYLSDDLRQILSDNKGIQSKIVQKYIQYPLLIKNHPNKGLYNKKFDIRQWVLLRSVKPLQIYIFNKNYGRLCSQQYNLNNLTNLPSHLTNYSLNKQYYQDGQNSVLSQQQIIQILRNQKGIDYQQQIKPKIIQIIINSIKSAKNHLCDFNKQCFSLLGYDILLDDDCQPWLLEVNMSPACQERTEWLVEYLRYMGSLMLKIILPRQYLLQKDKKATAQTKQMADELQTDYINNKNNQQQFDQQQQQYQITKDNMQYFLGKTEEQLPNYAWQLIYMQQIKKKQMNIQKYIRKNLNNNLQKFKIPEINNEARNEI